MNVSECLKNYEDQFKKNKPLTVVKPGTQSRRFTHISDTIDACIFAWKKPFLIRKYILFVSKRFWNQKGPLLMHKNIFWYQK